MPNPPNPINPNIVTGAHTGRVVTDRYDFQKHIEGQDFRHDGYALTLDPPVLIELQEYTDVHSAIAQLANLITPEPPPDASTSVKGLIRLAGDLGGTGTTALNPKVSGLQGFPVSTLAPSSSQVLTWNGSAWGPAAPANTFTAGGDLVGSNTVQGVASLGGANPIMVYSDGIRVSAQNEVFLIDHEEASNAPGAPLTIKTQSTINPNSAGGDFVVETGEGSGDANGPYGRFTVTVEDKMLEIAQLTTDARAVITLCGEANTTNMPANTGDKVIYIGEAATPPSTGVPIGGAILYARSNGLWTKNQDGYDFQIGSQSNPSIWGNAEEGQIFEYRVSIATSDTTPAIAFSKSLTDDGFSESVIKVEAVVLGRQSVTDNASIHNLTRGYVVSNIGTPTAMGTETSTDPRTTAGASGWTVPTITTSGTSIRVLTGANASTDILWFVYVKLTVNSTA